MKDLIRLIDENPGWFFAIWLVLFVVCFGIQFVRYRARAIRFPAMDTLAIRFHESRASGCSHRSLVTRLGGASRCLLVTVTETEVWIRLSQPFRLFASHADLEHRIALGAITLAEPEPSWTGAVRLEFTGADGTARRLTLHLAARDEFLGALRQPERPRAG